MHKTGSGRANRSEAGLYFSRRADAACNKSARRVRREGGNLEGGELEGEEAWQARHVEIHS